MATNDDITGLVNNLYRPSIFYVPESLIPNITEEMKQELLDFRVTNELVIIKANGEQKSYENCIPSIELLNKAKCLENNMVQLYKFKQLEDDAFKYILDKYLNHVTAYLYIYEWLYTHLNDNIKDATAEHKGYFHKQLLAIQGHALELTERFGSNTDPVATALEQENRSPIFGNTKVQQRANVISKSDEDAVKNKRTITKKKKVLLSDEEADKYLLETVFKVDLNAKTPI